MMQSYGEFGSVVVVWGQLGYKVSLYSMVEGSIGIGRDGGLK